MDSMNVHGLTFELSLMISAAFESDVGRGSILPVSAHSAAIASDDLPLPLLIHGMNG
jgi:hypothetical protein